MEIDNYGLIMIQRNRIIFLLTLNHENIYQLCNFKMQFLEPLVLCFIIITKSAGNIKFLNSSWLAEKLMSTSKELKDKYHYFVKEKEREE